MSQSIKDRFIPLVALLLGVAVVYAVGSFQQRTQAAAEAEIQQKFDALESVEQERLLDRAASMSEAPERFVPLQHIHTALKTDPELSDKLKRLHKWWLTLDPDNKNKLKSGNRFADGWVQQVKEVYLHTRNQPGEFVIKLRNWSDYRAPPEMFRTDEAAFRQFLEQILPKEEYPEDLRQRLSGLPGADQECERTLAVMISLREQIDRVGRSGEKPEDTARVARIGAAVSDTLFASEERQRLEQLAEEIVSNAPSDRIEGVRRMWQRYVTMAIFHHAKEHYSSVFHAKHLRQQRDSLIAMFNELDRSEQLELMSRDAREAEKNLERRLIEQTSQKNPAIAGIAEDLQNRDYWNSPWQSGRRSDARGRGRSGSGRPRGEGDRGEGGRPRGDEGPPGDRGRGPDREGRGSKDGQRDHEDRDRGGPRRNGPPPPNERPE